MACKGMNLQSFRWLECMCFEMEGNHLALPKAMWHSLDCVTCSYFEVGSGHSCWSEVFNCIGFDS